MAIATVSIVGNRAQPKPGTSLLEPDRPALPRWLTFILIFGFYLTFRGYHAFEGDQAYRIPLLINSQDPAIYASDPFVCSFHAFNPHRGYLTLLEWASKPFGLAPALFGLFALTFAATTFGVNRLASAVWPDVKARVGMVAVVLVLMAKAGNIGTNHLFEATLLDRLVGFALGWLAMASAVSDPRPGIGIAAVSLGLAALIHPSVGLQLALTLATTWAVWGLLRGLTGVGRYRSILTIGAIGLGLTPGLILIAGQGGQLFKGLPTQEFRLLSVMVQGPQHMLPSTWRMSQWLGWGCYPVLALLAIGRVGFERLPDQWPASRVRLVILMAVNLASLGLAYLAVEVVGDLRVTIFQPFRMATLARGLALMAVSGRVVALWDRGDFASRGRAVLVGVGLSGDWMLVVATFVDLGMAAVDWASIRGVLRPPRAFSNGIGLFILAIGFVFLARHDPESGHWPILGSLGALAIGSLIARIGRPVWSTGRLAMAMVVAWTLPVAAMVVPWVVEDPSKHKWSASLVGRCRFAEVPTDDLERLAVWCRDHTPTSSRFVGPPGLKTFRLWSRRSLAFNRGGSPYHAEGLVDWSRRYRDHVGFEGSTIDFVHAYLADRHGLETGYGRMTEVDLAALAHRQGATHVLTSVPVHQAEAGADGPLEQLRSEGRYVVFRVRSEILEKNSTASLFNRY